MSGKIFNSRVYVHNHDMFFQVIREKIITLVLLIDVFYFDVAK